MASKASQPQYLTVAELVERSGYSSASIHRLKAKHEIPFYQPAGKGGKLLFPPDALEQIHKNDSEPSANPKPQPREQLSGRAPAWMARSGRK
jgi:hypothetical protein